MGVEDGTGIGIGLGACVVGTGLGSDVVGSGLGPGVVGWGDGFKVGSGVGAAMQMSNTVAGAPPEASVPPMFEVMVHEISVG